MLIVASGAAAESPQIAGARLGLGDRYKLGCWTPLRLEVRGGDAPLAVQSTVAAPDSDGIGVATTAAGRRPLATEPGATSRDTVYVRIGQTGAELEAQLIAEGGVVARRTFPTDRQWSGQPPTLGEGFNAPTPATHRLYLQIGGPTTGTGGQMLNDLENRDDLVDLATAYVPDADQLPRDAIGYESFDAVVLLATSDGTSWLEGLTASDPRLRALTQWVESGGRLVVSCGAKGADLLAAGGPLAAFLPGEYAGPTTLANATAIESYTDASDDAGRLPQAAPLRISNLTGVKGTVEAYAGGSSRETPLVIRTPYGFGEVTFVAFDLDASAIAGWQGRSALLMRLLEAEPTTETDGAATPWTGFGARSDFVSQLTKRLDLEFAGVKTAPFLLIVGLVLLYLLLIGPGDYFLVKNLLKRVEATWITFPLLVLATSAAAYAGAYWLKGDRLRVNQVEIVEVDTSSGQTRGTLLTHLFSPRAQRYDLRLETKTLDDSPLEADASSTAWLGKPGSGLGGMQADAGSQGPRRANYQIDPTPLLSGSQAGPTIAGMPVQVWSTKSLISRYSGRSARVVDAQLAPDREAIIEGLLTNDTGTKLEDCRLLYGVWAWRLGSMNDGGTKSLNQSLDPVKITTLLRESNEDASASAGSAKLGSVAAIAESLSVGSLRSGASGAASRYLSYLDLSHHLEAGNALLLCRVNGGPRSQLLTDGKPLVDPTENEEEQSLRSWVFARFILPVGDE